MLIRQRVHATIGNWVSDAEAVQIAIACATRQPKDLLTFMFKQQVAGSAEKNAKLLAVTIDEWTHLFGALARPMQTRSIERTTAEKSFSESLETLQNALRCTVAETTQGKAWARACTRVACIAAIHTDNHEDLLAACLGTVVRADHRRLDDMKAELEDDGVDSMLLGQVLQSLSESVT